MAAFGTHHGGKISTQVFLQQALTTISLHRHRRGHCRCNNYASTQLPLRKRIAPMCPQPPHACCRLRNADALVRLHRPAVQDAPSVLMSPFAPRKNGCAKTNGRPFVERKATYETFRPLRRLAWPAAGEASCGGSIRIAPPVPLPLAVSPKTTGGVLSRARCSSTAARM